WADRHGYTSFDLYLDVKLFFLFLLLSFIRFRRMRRNNITLVKDITDNRHSWVKLRDITGACLIIEICSTSITNSFTVISAKNFHRHVHDKLTINQKVYVKVISIHIGL